MLKMLPRTTAVVLLFALLTFAQEQAPFDIPVHDRRHYEFSWPISKVAIIGAGVSGLISHREFTRAGFSVRLFERDSVPGGNWHYTENLTPEDAPVPDLDPEVSDYVPSYPPEGAELPYQEVYHVGDDNEQWKSKLERRRIEFWKPRPVWRTLRSNTPAPYQEITEFPWPKGSEWETPHFKIQSYLRAFASSHDVNSNDGNPSLSYNTRVESVDKRYNATGRHAGWSLLLHSFVKVDDARYRASWWREDFDAVVVASGRYNAPHIPDIPGLAEWTKLFPQNIIHSRQYRIPEAYTNETVLVIGASSSATEISRDVNRFASKSYLSVRDKTEDTRRFPRDIFLSRVPSNTSIIGEISAFLPPDSSSDDITKGRIELANGTILTGVSHIVFGTGYRYSYPFLAQYHNASLGRNGSSPPGSVQPLVTDGSHIRSLYKDLFYIAEPTIGLVNVNFGQQTFVHAEYAAATLARVWAGRARLPSSAEMWRDNRRIVDERGGYTKLLQLLDGPRKKALTAYFVSWLNGAAVEFGGRQVDNPPDRDELLNLWFQAHFGVAPEDNPVSSVASSDAQARRDAHQDVLWENW